MMHTEGTLPMPVKPYLILYYPASEVAKILTRVNEDVCKSINDYFSKKFKETLGTYSYTDPNKEDIVDIVNSVFIYHKNEIIKDKL